MVNSTSSSGTTKTIKKSHTDKIDALAKELANASGSRAQAGEFLNSSQLATSLFSRAPAEFLEHKTLADLVIITEHALSVTKRLRSQPGQIVIDSKNGQEHTALYVALSDRPFIINTITETLRRFNQHFTVILYPILNEGGQRISLSYLELTPKLSESQLEPIKHALKSELEDLILVTDDFSPMIARAETLAHLLNNPRFTTTFPHAEGEEIARFLRWLIDGSFVFLGHSTFRVEASGRLSSQPSSVLGIFRSGGSKTAGLISESFDDATALLETNEPISVLRMRSESLVHRHRRYVAAFVQELSADGTTVAVHVFVGQLTSKASSEESSTIPLIRRKLTKLLAMEQALENSHDYKNIINIIDSMPTDQAFRLSVDEMQTLARTILSPQNESASRVSVLIDSAHRNALVLVIVARDRFNTALRLRMQSEVEQLFGATSGSSEYYLDSSDKPFVRFYFSVPIPSESVRPLDEKALETQIQRMTRTWRDNLGEKIFASYDTNVAGQIWRKYRDAFLMDYQALHTVDDSFLDIQNMEALSEAQPIRVALRPVNSMAPNQSVTSQISVVVYSALDEITISKAVPVLENSGLEVLSEQSSTVLPHAGQPCYVCRFLTRLRQNAQKTSTELGSSALPEGLAQILQGQAENDILNSLMLTANLEIRSVELIRAYCCMLFQATRFTSRETITSTLALFPDAASRLWRLFDFKFNPTFTDSERLPAFQLAMQEYRDYLRNVTDLTRDRVLRSLATLIEFTVRTNFYSGASTIALKFHAEKIDLLPLPRPLFEIFVRSPLVEGVHLRGGMVARGGLRWSDRPDDYRSEILGLMKTQKIKNAVIVPTGAKGGFIVRKLPSEAHLVGEAVAEAYREFIRGLLSLTDNRVGAEIRHPNNMVIYDDVDPYLVVAADKGTAKFSDTANKIAVKEFDFWLGDAFASGGSQGYDHKIYGITAKGGWECVLRHFNDLGIDIAQPFSAVGIGDMAGDVFGNGMILSSSIMLLAAMNHKHIFIDPTPDPQASFAERKRLFDLPGSQWSDYNRALISKGGGIYGRFDKEIRLSSEARQALSISDSVPEVLDGEQLIALILKASVDLLWNGGIGTYVKATSESNSEVGDGTNDRVRVNAKELRAKVVGEGGNLGFTQRARIEFALRGGRINTDAIDNSGGVDLSDHEVNIKILFANILREKRITVEQRDSTLVAMASDVIDAVLAHNRSHALLLTSAVTRTTRKSDFLRALIRDMAKRGYVDRVLECLPSDEEINERVARQQGFTRPELAVCIAITKMWLKDTLLSSELLKDSMLQAYLFDYFPKSLKDNFSKDILNHPLASNITASELVNRLVHFVGITFVHKLSTSRGVAADVVIKSIVAAVHILEAEQIRKSLNSLDDFSNSKYFVNLTTELTDTLRNVSTWLVATHGNTLSLSDLILRYQAGLKQILGSVDSVLSTKDKIPWTARLTKLRDLGLPESAVALLAISEQIVPLFEMLRVVQDTHSDAATVSKVFSTITKELRLSPLLSLESALEPRDRWEGELLGSSFDEIRRAISAITITLIQSKRFEPSAIRSALLNAPGYDSLIQMIEDVAERSSNSAAITLAARQISSFVV